MCNVLKMIFTGCLLLLLMINVANAEELNRQQIKGLDEQVQEIKSEVLSIAVDLNQLEERLLYPSHTQVSIFVSLREQESFRLDSVEIELDGDVMVNHIYTYKELEALKKGGVQRIYTGNVKTGEHALQVSFSGLSAAGNTLKRSESFTVRKDVGPRIVELTLDHQGITLNDR